MTTIGVNVGDDFIREGICSFIDDLLPGWQPFYVNKHDLTTLHNVVYDESTLLADKFIDADVIIQAGAPVYWKIGNSTSYNVEWAEELWRKRIFRLGPEKPILNIAAGACQPYPDTVQTFLADRECVDFARRAAAACRWTSVRDPLAAQILLILGLDHEALPCSAFHAARRVRERIQPENIIGINLMPLGGHFQLRKDITHDAWQKTVFGFLAGARRYHQLVFIAHDQQELAFMESLRQGDEQVFHSTDYRDYLPVYARCQAVVANRVHGAVCAAGFGVPSVIIGNDTRLMIGDFIGLPSYYVAEVTAGEMLDRLNELLADRGAESDRLLTLREESARSYVASIGEAFAAAGIEIADNISRKMKETPIHDKGDGSNRSIHRTVTSFARRFSLKPPDLSLSHIMKELLAGQEKRNLIRYGADVLIIGDGADPLAWFLASLGSRVSVAIEGAGSATEKTSTGFTRLDAMVSHIRMVSGRIPLDDDTCDIVIILIDRQAAVSEALRVLKPAGTFIMPENKDFEMPGQKNLPGEEGMVIGCKLLPLKQKGRILIPRFDTFGDIVLFESFLESVQKKYPDMELCLLVRKGYDELAALFPAELRLRWITVDQQAYKSPAEQKKSEFAGTVKKLAEESWDAVLLTTFNRTWLDEIFIDVFIGPNIVMLGPAASTGGLRGTTGGLRGTNRIIVPVDEWTHETEKYRLLFEKLTGDSAGLPKPRLEISADLADGARRELARLDLADTPYVACLPAGTQNQQYKVWPLERYAEVLIWLNECHGLVPLLIGHELEEASIRSLAGMLAAKGVRARSWLGHTGGIPMLGALLKQAAIYVGNDSGPMHFAAAFDVPVVGVFGGGTFPRFIPASDRSIAVVAEIPCFRCYWECIFGDAPCIRLVDVESVKKAIQLVMEDNIPSGGVLNMGVELQDGLIEIVDRAKSVIARKQGEYIKQAQNLRNELNQERAKSTAYQNSLSWRLTAPLRKLGKLL